MAKKIEEYSTDKLKNNIKLNGWIIVILTVAILFFCIDLISDSIQENNVNRTSLYAIIAMAAGTLSSFLQRKKMIKELESRGS